VQYGNQKKVSRRMAKGECTGGRGARKKTKGYLENWGDWSIGSTTFRKGGQERPNGEGRWGEGGWGYGGGRGELGGR